MVKTALLKSASLCAAALLLAAAVGCNNYEKREYNVVIKNNSARPITVGLTKSGPKYEKNWATPEDIAVIYRGDSKSSWGLRVPPGRVGSSNLVEGEFAPATSAIVRVYAGELTMDEILAIGKGSRRRADVRINPGPTLLTVTDKGDGIDVYTARPVEGDPDFAPIEDPKAKKKKK